MPDIRSVLDEAAPQVTDFDLDHVRRRADRRRAVPRAVGAAVAVVAIAVGVIVATAGDDGAPRRVESGTTPPTTSGPATTVEPTTTVPTTTVAPPPPTVPLGEDRLSVASRLGYTGLGPIKLGMAFDDAVAAAQVTVQPDATCETTLHGAPDSGVESITVWGQSIIDTITVLHPGIQTISGIEVGDTRADVLAIYPFATESGSSLVITGPGGQIIVFIFEQDDIVTSMSLAVDDQVGEMHVRC